MAQSNSDMNFVLQQSTPTAEAPCSKMSVKRNSKLEYDNFELHPYKKRKDVKDFSAMSLKSVEMGSHSSSQEDGPAATDVRTLNMEIIQCVNMDMIQGYLGQTKKQPWKEKELLLKLNENLEKNKTRVDLVGVTRAVSDAAGNSDSALSGQMSKNISNENIQIANSVENRITEENRTSIESVVQSPISDGTDDSRELITISLGKCAADTGSAVEDLALKKHREALQSYCRMCCRRRRITSLKPAVLLKLYLSEKLMKDFTSENPDVYPTKFCSPCINKVKKFQKMSPTSPFPYQFHVFRPHDALCILCINEKVYQLTSKDADVTEGKTEVTNTSVVELEGLGSIMSDVAAIQQSNAKNDILEANKTLFKSYHQHESSKSSVDVNVLCIEAAAADNTRESISRPNKEVKEFCIRQAGNDKKTCFQPNDEGDSYSRPSDGSKRHVRPFEGVHSHIKLSDEREAYHRPNEMGKTNGKPSDERESCIRLNEQSRIHTRHDENDSCYKFNDYSTVEIDSKGELLIVGLPLMQVIDSQRKIAEVISCFHCQTVPLEPYISRCSHIFCKSCVEKAVADLHNCTSIGRRLKLSQRDISPDTVGLYKTLVNTFLFKCKNICNFMGTAQEVLSHQTVCTMEMRDEILGVCESETRLKIEKFLEYGDRYCEDNKVSQEFILFYSLRRFLKLKGDKKRVALLMRLWEDTEELGGQLSPEDCLALRVSLGQQQKSYRYHYNFLKKHVSISNLRSPKQIEQLEKMFYPPFTDFSIESQEGITLYKRVIDEVVEPSDLGELVSTSGFRWKFTAAIAKTLQELAFEFQDQLMNVPDAKFLVEMCDKYEKVKDVKLSKLRKNTKIARYVIRYSFRILTISAVIDEQKSILYSSERAGSLSTPRTLALALPSDCRKDNVKLLLHPIEEEKRSLCGKYLCVRLPNGTTGKFSLSVSSVINYGNESLDLVSLGNLDVNEYGEFCMLCHTDKSHWLDNLGSSSITEDWKTCPSNYLMNPVQFDVNFIKLLNEVVVRESACVYRNPSECTNSEKLVLRAALKKMQLFLLQEYDIQPDSLILEPEEYVKKFFTAWNRGGAVNFIHNKVKQSFVRELFWRYCELRSMYLDHYTSGKTKIIKVIKVKSFKSKALIWIKYLFNRFPYISPSSYLHILVEHGEELIQLPNNPEFLSNASEAVALNPFVKSKLVGDLKNWWLKTSPYLRKKGRSYRKTTKCRSCSKRGHATKNCTKRKI